MTPEERLDRYAQLAVEVGANVGAGPERLVVAMPEHAPLVRAVARRAYANGTRYVDVDYQDQHVRRARIELAEEDTLGRSPPWLLAKLGEVALVDGDSRVGRSGLVFLNRLLDENASCHIAYDAASSRESRTATARATPSWRSWGSTPRPSTRTS